MMVMLCKQHAMLCCIKTVCKAVCLAIEFIGKCNYFNDRFLNDRSGLIHLVQTYFIKE